ncbi:hypothetical protein STEG23_011902, partial [Scotinomys teguina]
MESRLISNSQSSGLNLFSGEVTGPVVAVEEAYRRREGCTCPTDGCAGIDNICSFVPPSWLHFIQVNSSIVVSSLPQYSNYPKPDNTGARSQHGVGVKWKLHLRSSDRNNRDKKSSQIILGDENDTELTSYL